MDLSLPCKETRNLVGHQGAVRAVRFNFDGNYCLTCGSDKLLKLWNPHKGGLLKTYSGHGYEVLDAVGSSDNGRVASCGADKTVILWDVATGQIIRRFRGHTSVSDRNYSFGSISPFVSTFVSPSHNNKKSRQDFHTALYFIMHTVLG